MDITELEMAFAKDPASDAFLSLSEAYLTQGRFMEAMVVCKKGIKSKPDSLDGRILLSRIYAEQGKLPKALDEISNLLQEKPDYTPALVQQGQILDKQGSADEAVASFKKALDLDPQDAQARAALSQRGIDYQPPRAAPPPPPAPPPTAPAPAATPGTRPPSLPPAPRPGSVAPAAPAAPATRGAFNGQILDPNQGLKPARRVGPGATLGLLAVLGVVLFIFVAASIFRYQSMRKIDALNTAALDLVRKDTSASLGKAVEKLDEVLAISDDQELALGLKAFALVQRVYVHGFKGDMSALDDALAKAVKSSDTSWRYAAEIVSTMSKGELQAAEDLGKKILAEGYATVQTYVAYGEAARANGHVELAGEALKKAREDGPSSIHAQVASGEFFRHMLDQSRARPQYDAALRAEPNNARALAGRAMLGVQDPARISIQAAYLAKIDWESIRDIGRNDVGPQVWARGKTVAALLYKLEDKQDDAKAALAEALDPKNGAPMDTDVQLMNGRVLLMLGEKEQGIASLRKAASSDPNRMTTHLALANALIEAGKYDEVETALRAARKVDKENVQIVVIEAKAKRRAKNYDAAIALLLKADKERAGDPVVVLALLDTYRAAKKHNEAKELFKRIEEEHGDNKAIMTEGLVLLGRSFLNQNDNATATNFFKEAINQSQRNADAYFFLGYALRTDRKEQKTAVAALDKYLQIAPGGVYAERAKKTLETLR